MDLRLRVLACEPGVNQNGLSAVNVRGTRDMTRMRKHRPDFNTIENFRDFIEAVEVARNFLVANTPQKVRLALIALDNTAELLMTQICREMFEHDEFVAKICRPRFSRKFKKECLWAFGTKTELMKSEGNHN